MNTLPKIVLLLMVLLTSIFSVAAQEVATDTQATSETTVKVTPDQPIFWGLKRAIENLDELITLNKAEKAQKGLLHARERLIEVEAMITAKKLDAAAKAEVAHKEKLEKVKKNIEEVSSDDAEEELEEKIELEKEAKKQEIEVEKLKTRVKVEIKGELSAEQQARLDALLQSLEGSTTSVKIKIDAEKDKTKIKIKATKGKTDKEIEELEIEIEEKNGIGEIVRELAKAQRENELVVEVEGQISAEAQAALDSLVSELKTRTTGKVAIELKTDVSGDKVTVEEDVEGTLTESEKQKLAQLNAVLQKATSDIEIEIELEKGIGAEVKFLAQEDKEEAEAEDDEKSESSEKEESRGTRYVPKDEKEETSASATVEVGASV